MAMFVSQDSKNKSRQHLQSKLKNSALQSKQKLQSDEDCIVESQLPDFLSGGGEMGKVIQSMDWSKTPLGPIESWSQSLRTTVSLCLASNFPISIAWGPEHTQIYNDGYWPICGAKHPDSMGQNFVECWASPWPVIGESFERALAGQTSYLENQRMFLDRNGYLEETFFTFSFSPIRDETGGVGGLFHPVTEQTAKMLSERRTRALRDLAARTGGKSKAVEEVFTLTAEVLAEYDLDLPFTLFYLLDSDEKSARLVANTGLNKETTASPSQIELNNACFWDLTDSANSEQSSQVVLGEQWHSLSCGPYPEPPKTAFILPIVPPGSENVFAILIAGVSARLPVDEAYQAFYELLVATITASIANAQAYEKERKRAEALAEIDRAKTAFFSNVSHEFRTPLTLMLGPLEEALSDQSADPKTQHERLDMVYRNTLRLKKLVNTLLDFSRIEAGRVQAHYQPTDLPALTQDLASMFRSAIEQVGLELVVDCPTLSEPIYVDRDMWEKIVLNLLSNAFKHTFEGKITVRLSTTENGIKLCIQDTGVGIPTEQLPHLFERFHRVPNARSRTHEGSGIGLALVHELVKLHGGTILADSTLDCGTTLKVFIPSGKIHLPATQVEMEPPLLSTDSNTKPFIEEALRWLPEETSATLSQNDSSGTEIDTIWMSITHPGKARILLADDNLDMRAYVSRLLQPYCEVEAVSDGLAALAATRRSLPDLILSDIMMPQMDGFEFLKALREDPALEAVPIIFLSARAGNEAKVEGLTAGANDYLVKPFNAAELLARVKTNLDLHRIRYQSEIKKLNAELEQRITERTIQLQTVNKELESFSYSVSHDLRAPLRSINGFSQVLLENYNDKLDEEGKAYLSKICQNTQEMGTLMDALLKLSRVTRGSLEKVDINLTPLAQNFANELKRQEPDRAEVEFKIQDNIMVYADIQLIQSVLGNLIGNAWKYSSKQAHARIEFATMKRNGQTVYFVKDNGAGFNMKFAERLFGPFQRLHSSREFPGNGVGLATVARIIQRHGGEVWAEGEPEKGATFYFTLGES
jgi:signal transduction histidine kinase